METSGSNFSMIGAKVDKIINADNADEGTTLSYDSAGRVVADAKSFDDVLDFRNRDDAMKVYASHACNQHLELDASGIRFRAERRLGQLIADQRDSGNLRGVHGSPLQGQTFFYFGNKANVCISDFQSVGLVVDTGCGSTTSGRPSHMLCEEGDPA